MDTQSDIPAAGDTAGPTDLDRLSANVVRGLAIDAIERSGGGHPGLPLGMADVAVVLWRRFLRHDPSDPSWPDRDRFVLSAGHGGTLLYSLLHLGGYDLPIEELMRHRALGSATPGHPERGVTPGVETTTGPLGQGLGNAVGMAIAEAKLAATFNRPGFELFDHRTYCIVGDGDLEEGIGHEAASLAGHLGLGKLILLFDDNRMTIDGPTSVAVTEDTLARFEAYGWHTQQVAGYDVEAIDGAIRAAQRAEDRPSIIACRTIIGYGSPRQDTPQAHAMSLGEDGVRSTKAALGLPVDEMFWVPASVRDHWDTARARGHACRLEWESRLAAYHERWPDLARSVGEALAGRLPDGWDAQLPRWEAGECVAPRAVTAAVVDAVLPHAPTLLGGSADLSMATGARPAAAIDIERASFGGNFLRYGIREHAMGAILNGLALHGGVTPYASTFLTFSDYMRPAVRVGALMEAPAIFVWTHDSVGIGEDGPTHQSVEHLAALRSMPGLVVLRPADANEAVEAWRYALTHRDRPIALVLARQDLPVLHETASACRDGVPAGAYVLADGPGTPDVIVLATGSEVPVALAASRILRDRGVQARVVSMPAWRLFDEQDQAYREAVLPRAVTARVSVEAGATLGWHRYVGCTGATVGIDRFGVSGPPDEVLAYLGITAERVAEEALRVLRP